MAETFSFRQRNLNVGWAYLPNRIMLVFSIKKDFQNISLLWGRFGFDGVIVCIKLRVRALFSVINEQLKLNANNVIEGNFGRSAARLAA